MAAEISLFVDSIRMHQDTATLKTIHVSGGVSNHPMAMRQLSEKLGLPCQQWNPIRHVGAAHRALQDFSILGDLAHLPAAAGAAFQCAA
jgi:Tfp pilus assembly PilM family ATPase